MALKEYQVKWKFELIPEHRRIDFLSPLLSKVVVKNTRVIIGNPVLKLASIEMLAKRMSEQTY